MDLGIRKRDLADRLQLLVREAASTVELVNLMLKSCERIVDEVCDTDRCIFLSQYPLVIKYLDTRIHHALEFNCVTDSLIIQDIKYENEGISITEATQARNAAAGDRPRPSPSPALQPPQQKLSKGPDLGVASIKCEGDRIPGTTLSEQPSSCVEVVASPSKPSRDPPETPKREQLEQQPADNFNATNDVQRPVVLESGTDPKSLERQPAKLRSPAKKVSTPVKKSKNAPKREKSSERLPGSGAQTKAEDDTTATNDVQQPVVSIESDENLNSKEPDSPAKKASPPARKARDVVRSTSVTKVSGFPASVCRPASVGEEREVMLSHIETPHEFYVHIACEENATLDSFQAEINAFYDNNKVILRTKSVARARMGSFCMCHQPEIGWCRAQVLKWCPEGDHIEIQLVDYGDVCFAHLDVIQPILPEFAARPLFATRCHLAFVEPPPPNDTWPPESAKVFNCYMPPTTKNKTAPLDSAAFEVPRVYTIVKAETDDIAYVPCDGAILVHQTSISVILRDDSDAEKLTMNDNLVDLGYAGSPNFEATDSQGNAIVEAMDSQGDVKVDSGLNRDKHNIVISDRKSDVENWVMDPEKRRSEHGDGDSLRGWNPMEEDFLDPSESREDAVLAVSGYSAQDEKRVCRFFANNGQCYKGGHCRMEHSFVHRDGYTTDKELVYTHAYSMLEMPPEDGAIRLTVTHVPKGRNFFHAVIPPGGCRPHEETLATLQRHLNDPKIVSRFARLRIPPALGQMVLAFSRVDSSFHRSRVVDEIDDDLDTVEVVFVDSGRTETVHERDLRAIEPSALHLPFQAVECHLANVEISDLTASSDHVRSVCLGRTLAARVVSSLEDVQVLYCLLADPNGRDVGRSLVRAGLGYERDPGSKLVIMPL